MRVFLPAVLFLSAILGWVGLTSTGTPIPEKNVTNRPIQLAEDGYASSRACESCHPNEYATWHSSYHRSMTQVATPETVLADFDGVTVGDVHGRPMNLERRDNRFWAEFDDPDWDGTGDAPARIEREVVMITGSHNQQIYWYATGQDRLLGQLPGAYLLAEQRWIPRRWAVLYPPGEQPYSETGHWNSTCLACHATHPKPEFDTPFGSQPIGTQVIDTTTVEHGISCEACHGPSEEHARLNRSPLRRYALHFTGEPDASTVQPQRLDPKRSSQVCGQCHSIWEFYDQAGERLANSEGLPYKPGDELTDTRFLAQPTHNADSPAMRELLASDPGFIRDSFWSDGQVRVSGREYNGLIESPCFALATEPSRTLSCFSCHTLHKTGEDPRPVKEWANDQLGLGMDSDQACTQCHESVAANVQAHTNHVPGSSGSSCYNCHMPYTAYGLLKTIRSHTVSSPSVAESVETGRPNACNLCHLDKTLGWTSEALDRWYGAAGPTLSEDEQSVAASVLWLLRGDGGQRAIVAQAMAWPPAQEASRTGWMAPFLAQLLDDPYDAVRFIGSRSLLTLPGFSEFSYDFVWPQEQRYDAQLRAMAVWDTVRPTIPESALLLDANGSLRIPDVLRILRARDNRLMLLRE